MIQVEDIPHMDREALVAGWRNLNRAPPPKGLGLSMLRRLLAFEIQARQRGGLSKATMAGLKQRGPTPKPSKRLAAGGRLIRDWNGVTHVVEVTEAGFVWRDRTWRSLSAIAREITGAHWSGPRFFGVKAGR